MHVLSIMKRSYTLIKQRSPQYINGNMVETDHSQKDASARYQHLFNLLSN